MKPTIQELRDNNDGTLPAYAWPGGYQIIYYDRDNCVLCPDCANNNDDSFDAPVVAWEIYYEGPTIQCEQCYKEIESEYGDPDEE